MKNRLENTVRPVMRSKSHKGISFSLVETSNRQWGALCAWGREEDEGVSVEWWMEESLYCFPREEVKEVTARHDRSDRSGWPVRPVGPWQLEIVLQWMFLSEELMRNFELWNLIDIGHYSKVSSFSWYFQENRRDRFGFYGLELVEPLVTSQQSIKENYSHKWLNWVTKTKKQILSYTLTLPIMLLEFFKSNYLMSHKTWKCTH